MKTNCIQVITHHPYQFAWIMTAIFCCALAILSNLNIFSSDISAPLAYCSTAISILIILGIVIHNCRNKNRSILSPQVIDISKIVDNDQTEAQTVALKNPFEYAMLHYKLAQMTEQAIREGTQEEWLRKLHKLHQNVHIVFSKGEKFILDCSIEFDRLKDKTIELEFIELTFEDLKRNRKLFDSFFAALRESFDSIDENYIKDQFSDQSRLFVGRNKNNQNEILGGLFVQKRKEGFFIHSLCRRAKATKIHLTENLKKFIENEVYRGQKGNVYCEVNVNNLPIKNLYQKLGFVICGQGSQKDRELMRLQIN